MGDVDDLLAAHEEEALTLGRRRHAPGKSEGEQLVLARLLTGVHW